MLTLVTGISGHLGSRLVRLLVEKGERVRGSYRPGDNPGPAADLLDEAMPCDALDRAGVERLVQGVDRVFNVAAMVTFDPSLYERQVRVNVEGTRRLVEAAAQAGVRRLVHTSTVNTLGIPLPGRVGDEQTPSNWQRYGMGYMDSKRESEALVLAANVPGALETLAVLPGTMFGPWDVNDNGGTYIKLAARGVLLAAPPGGTSVVHVDDVARGHILAMEQGQAGRRYVLGGENLTYRRIFTLIARALDRRGPLLTLPMMAAAPLARLSDRLRERTGLPLKLQEGQLVAASSRLFYSSERAIKELGYTFRPAPEALEDAVRWYEETGRI